MNTTIDHNSIASDPSKSKGRLGQNFKEIEIGYFTQLHLED